MSSGQIMHSKVNGRRVSTEVSRRGCGKTGQPGTFEKTEIVGYLLFNPLFWSVAYKRKDTLKFSVSVGIFRTISRN